LGEISALAERFGTPLGEISALAERFGTPLGENAPHQNTV
jgi:hypothetical protein